MYVFTEAVSTHVMVAVLSHIIEVLKKLEDTPSQKQERSHCVYLQHVCTVTISGGPSQLVDLSNLLGVYCTLQLGEVGLRINRSKEY